MRTVDASQSRFRPEYRAVFGVAAGHFAVAGGTGPAHGLSILHGHCRINALGCPVVWCYQIGHEPARQDRDPPLHLSARLPVGLCARYRGGRGSQHWPRPRFEKADLHGRRGLRQGRPLCRAHPSPGAGDVSDAPDGTERLRPVCADFLGRGAGRDRRSLQPGRARVRRGIDLAVLLRRHDGAGDARRPQPPHACEEIFALLSDHLRQCRAHRLCDRHRQDRRRRSARDGAVRSRRDLGHQSRQHAGQRDDACRACAEGARRENRGGRHLRQRDHEAGGYQDPAAARHRRRVCLRRDACSVPRRLCRPRLYGQVHRLPRRARGASEDAHAGMGVRDLRRAGGGDRGLRQGCRRDQADLLPARLRFHAFAQRRDADACGELHSRGDRRLAVRGRRRLLQQLRAVAFQRSRHRRP